MEFNKPDFIQQAKSEDDDKKLVKICHATFPEFDKKRSDDSFDIEQISHSFHYISPQSHLTFLYFFVFVFQPRFDLFRHH